MNAPTATGEEDEDPEQEEKESETRESHLNSQVTAFFIAFNAKFP